MPRKPHQLSITTLQTNLPVQPQELEAVKKALSAWLKLKGFAQHGYIHNHKNEEDPAFETQSYPLIQLRCKEEGLLLWGMKEGAEVLQQIMMTEMLRGFQYRGTQCRILPKHTGITQQAIVWATGRKMQQYELNYFVALNPANFTAWQQLPDATQRMRRLEELLINNMAMFCKAAGFVLDKTKLKLHIDWLWHTHWVAIKEYSVLAFTLTYHCNLLLPDGIALGRQTKLGYGWQAVLRSAE
jgi:hypothetical protein